MKQATLHRSCPSRSGKVLALVVLLFPAIFGVAGMVFDSGLMSADRRSGQHAADAAATAAAMDLYLGKGASIARDTAEQYVQDVNGLADITVTTNIPPQSGPYAGNSNFVEVLGQYNYRTRLIHLLGGTNQYVGQVRAVAGHEPATDGAAIVVLDPSPEAIDVAPIPGIIPIRPAILGGLEILGLGNVSVNGAVLVNTGWGGVDQDGEPAGESEGPPYGVSCSVVLPLTRLSAQDIRVAGGVDNPEYYGHYDPEELSPLQANRLPVPDPLISLPVPTTSVDPANVSDEEHGGVQVMALPLIVAPTTLSPGVYDWIEVISGSVVFEPGVYVIRSVNPVSGIALNLKGGIVSAEGVVFYITNSADYDVTSGAPDNGDGDDAPEPPTSTTLTPSVVINGLLPGTSFSPLSDPSSPYHGMLIYQRRQDRRPVVIGNLNLLGASVSGTIYAKWGHVLLTAQGTHDLRIAAGTARIVAVTDVTFDPSDLLPPARDVFLVE